MFPDKYKHHSRQPKGLLARLASKATTLFKRDGQVSETASSWVI